MHAIHIVDERGENCAGGMPVKETRRAAQRGLVKMVAQVRDGAEAGITYKVGSQIVAEAFQNGGDDQGEGYDIPRIVQMQEVRDETAQIEVPLGFWKAEEDWAFRRARGKHAIEDRL